MTMTIEHIVAFAKGQTSVQAVFRYKPTHSTVYTYAFITPTFDFDFAQKIAEFSRTMLVKRRSQAEFLMHPGDVETMRERQYEEVWVR